MSESQSGQESLGLRAVGWVCFILFGPTHFGDEMGGPTAATDWRQWVCMTLGRTFLRVGVALVVIQHV